MGTEANKFKSPGGHREGIAPIERLRADFRVVGAVLRQRWLTFRSYPVAFYMWPLAFLMSFAAVMFMAKAFSAVPTGLDSPEASLVPPGPNAGIVTTETVGPSGAFPDFRPFLLVSTVLWTYIEGQLYLGFSVESEMKRGTAETVLATPASRWAFLTGHALFQFVRSTLNAFASVVFGVAFFGVPGVLGPNWVRTLCIFFLNLLLVYGYGLMLAGALVVVRSGFFSYAWDCLIPLLAGSTFSVSVLPPMLRKVALAIPLTHGLDLLRWSAAGYPTVLPPRMEAWVLGISAVLLPIMGHAVFKALERVARKRGTLGQF